MLLERMRQCRLNFAEHRYDCEAGIVGEHNATELIITPPAIMPDEAVYRLCFEPGGVSEIIPKMSDGTLAYPLPAAVTATAFCCMTLIGYIGNEQVYKSRMVQLHFCRAADGDADIDPQQPGIVAEVNRNTAARHSHDNKTVIDLLTADDTGTLLYDGKTVTGASDLTIGMTVEGDGEKFKVTSCDATIEQIDDALVNGQRIAVVVTGENAKFLLPLLQGTQGEAYYFGSFLLGQTAAAYVWKDTSSGISTWTFGMYQIEAEAIDYLNAALPNISTVGGALDELTEVQQGHENDIITAGEMLDDLDRKSHTHSNKDVLDKLSAANGKLQYDGSDISITKTGVINALGYTPQAVSSKIATGSSITLADNTEYRLTNVSTLTLTYPTSDFQEHSCILQRCEDQHHRHPRSCGLWWRG
nr:MAG TPA: hypothetical protein [Caudoviricetes sp.]